MPILVPEKTWMVPKKHPSGSKNAQDGFFDHPTILVASAPILQKAQSVMFHFLRVGLPGLQDGSRMAPLGSIQIRMEPGCAKYFIKNEAASNPLGPNLWAQTARAPNSDPSLHQTIPHVEL